MAALNSAYIVSNDFLKTLVTKINFNFSIIQKRFQVVETNSKNNHEKLIEGGSKVSSDAPDAIKKLFNKSKKLTQEIDSFKVSLDEKISENSISSGFNYLCWLGALYCVLILILNGWGFELSTPYQLEIFLLFNILVIILIVLITFEKKLNWFYPTYKLIVGLFFVIVVFTIFSFFILQLLYPIRCATLLIVVGKITAILIPIFHFIYFFLKSIRVSRNECDKLTIKIDNLDKSLEDFAKKMKIIFDVASEFQITKEDTSKLVPGVNESK